MDEQTRREFMAAAGGAAVAGMVNPQVVLASSTQDRPKQRAIVVWFAHNICRAGSAGELVDEKYIADGLATCVDHGINTIYWQARYVGPAIYRSKVVAPFDASFEKLWREGTPTFDVSPAHDVQGRALADVLRRLDPYDVGLREAKRRGLTFIAQVSVFDMWFPILPDRHYEKHPEQLLTDRTQKIHATGLPCYAEPGARQYCLAEIQELLDRGADGISLDLASHQNGFWDPKMGEKRPDALGFNPPLVDAYKQRHGVNVLEEAFDPDQWHALHGEFFTGFLRQVKNLLGDKPLIVGVPPCGFLGYGGNAIGVTNPNYATQSPACRINLEWKKWLTDRIVDAVRVYTEDPSDVPTVTEMSEFGKGRFFFSRWVPVKKMDEVRRQLAQVESSNLDGYVLHEHTYFESNPKLWGIFGA